MNVTRKLAPMVFGLAAVLTSTFPAASQSSRIDIGATLQDSLRLQRSALQTLPSDPGRAEKLIANAHAQLQAAHSAMVIRASDMKFPDPLLPFNDSKAREALGLLQRASDTLKLREQASAAGDPIAAARNYLDQAARLTGMLAGTF